jgi:ribose transport system permease protein
VRALVRNVDQQAIVLLIAVGLFLVFAISLKGFATAGNLLSLLQGMAVTGVLGIAMAIVIIGRGIDLSMISVMVMPVAWEFLEISCPMA